MAIYLFSSFFFVIIAVKNDGNIPNFIILYCDYNIIIPDERKGGGRRGQRSQSDLNLKTAKRSLREP
jgi:hypothetical protein